MEANKFEFSEKKEGKLHHNKFELKVEFRFDILIKKNYVLIIELFISFYLNH